MQLRKSEPTNQCPRTHSSVAGHILRSNDISRFPEWLSLPFTQPMKHSNSIHLNGTFFRQTGTGENVQPSHITVPNPKFRRFPTETEPIFRQGFSVRVTAVGGVKCSFTPVCTLPIAYNCLRLFVNVCVFFPLMVECKRSSTHRFL